MEFEAVAAICDRDLAGRLQLVYLILSQAVYVVIRRDRAVRQRVRAHVLNALRPVQTVNRIALLVENAAVLLERLNEARVERYFLAVRTDAFLLDVVAVNRDIDDGVMRIGLGVERHEDALDADAQRQGAASGEDAVMGRGIRAQDKSQRQAQR